MDQLQISALLRSSFSAERISVSLLPLKQTVHTSLVESRVCGSQEKRARTPLKKVLSLRVSLKRILSAQVRRQRVAEPQEETELRACDTVFVDSSNKASRKQSLKKRLNSRAGDTVRKAGSRECNWQQSETGKKC